MIGTTCSRVSFFMNSFASWVSSTTTAASMWHSPLLNVVLHEQPEIKVRLDWIRRMRISGHDRST